LKARALTSVAIKRARLNGLKAAAEKNKRDASKELDFILEQAGIPEIDEYGGREN